MTLNPISQARDEVLMLEDDLEELQDLVNPGDLPAHEDVAAVVNQMQQRLYRVRNFANPDLCPYCGKQVEDLGDAGLGDETIRLFECDNQGCPGRDLRDGLDEDQAIRYPREVPTDYLEEETHG